MDLAQGATWSYSPAAVENSHAKKEIADTDAIVIAAGRGGRKGESRLELLRDNAAVVRDLGTASDADPAASSLSSQTRRVLTRSCTQATGLPAFARPPEHRHDARHRTTQTGNRPGRRAHRSRIPFTPMYDRWHGDSEVVLWSSARAEDATAKLARLGPIRMSHAAEHVRRAATGIIRRKGATNHAIRLVTRILLRSVLRNERRVLTVSRLQEGALGLRDIALSLPAVVGADGTTEDRQTRDERRRTPAPRAMGRRPASSSGERDLRPGFSRTEEASHEALGLALLHRESEAPGPDARCEARR